MHASQQSALPTRDENSRHANATLDAADVSSARRGIVLFALVAVCALIGLGDSLYLTVQHLSGASVRCTIANGCSEVLSSSYATIGGVPLALVGAIAYFAAFSLATLAVFDRAQTLYVKLLRLLSVLMCLTSLLLVLLQAFVIKHFCEFCLLSAFISFTIGALLLYDLLAARKRLSHS